MTAFLAMLLLLGGLLATGLLFATSSSIRSLVRRIYPEYESTILLPADDWYMPQNIFGNFRPVAVFMTQPSALTASPAFRSSLALARSLLLFGILALAGAFVCGLAA
jgi:hypothetical protein